MAEVKVSEMVDRSTLIAELFEQLQKIPNWKVVLKNENMSAEELQKFYAQKMESIDFKRLYTYIKCSKKGLQLTYDEIPNNLWFQLIIFSMYGYRYVDDTDWIVYWRDDRIWDVFDEKTYNKILEIAELLKIKLGLFTYINVEYTFSKIISWHDFISRLQQSGF